MDDLSNGSKYSFLFPHVWPTHHVTLSLKHNPMVIIASWIPAGLRSSLALLLASLSIVICPSHSPSTTYRSHTTFITYLPCKQSICNWMPHSYLADWGPPCSPRVNWPGGEGGVHDEGHPTFPASPPGLLHPLTIHLLSYFILCVEYASTNLPSYTTV